MAVEAEALAWQRGDVGRGENDPAAIRADQGDGGGQRLAAANIGQDLVVDGAVLATGDRAVEMIAKVI